MSKCRHCEAKIDDLRMRLCDDCLAKRHDHLVDELRRLQTELLDIQAAQKGRNITAYTTTNGVTSDE